MPIVLSASCSVALTVNGTEVAGNNYARQPATFTPMADPDYAANLEALLWDTAYPNGWGLIDSVVLYNDLGVLIASAVPVHTVTVDPYEAVRIRPGGFIIGPGPSVGRPYGMRAYGTWRYAKDPGYLAWVDLIEIGFDRFDPCKPGTWAPAAACSGAAWAPVDLCSAGDWSPAQQPLRRAA